MITTGFDTRIKVQQVIDNQLPEFVLSESPKAAEFLKQYYISQEYQGGNIDIVDNLDQYLKLDNLTSDVISGETALSSGITTTSGTINVGSTKGFPKEYGLLKIDDEIITYTGLTTNTFTGCVRGFSGISSYHADNAPEELVFSDTAVEDHTSGTKVTNLSSLFLKEFYTNIKHSLTPGLEDADFVSTLNVSNFIKEARTFYQSKGTEESFRILFNVLFGVTPKVVDLEEYLVKPSSAEFIRREIVLAEVISGDPNLLVGQTVKKSTDNVSQASVSEVEIVTRKGVSYYKLGLFIGFNEKELIKGSFTIPGKTKVLDQVSIGSSVITVDSTVGFGATGTVICGINTTINYTDKTINQFLNCTNITSGIGTAADLRSNEIIYGYENGDTSKKVELRITGVLSEFVPVSDINLVKEGEKITVRNLGQKIRNPESGKTKKEIIANTWIYNTSTRYQVKQISGSTFTLYSDIDDSSLKEGDSIDVLFRNEQNIAVSNATISNINSLTKEVFIGNLSGFTPLSNKKYDIRRNLKTAYSNVTDIHYGNNKITSDIQNVYIDENDKNLYVAANSLPSYEIKTGITQSILADASGSAIQGLSAATAKYSIISFSSDVPFLTGDAIWYTPDTTVIPGLREGLYYVKVLSNKNQIKLYISRSFINTDQAEEFEPLPVGSGSHTFVLSSQRNKRIGAQKLLKKFPIEANIKSGNGVETNTGTLGILINGVEIANYKSDDKIFYGPLDRIKILNGGSNYDVINPPKFVIGDSPVVGATTALARPVVSGSVKEVYVDPQDFDIEKINSITLVGGNGDGAVLEASLGKRFRELHFDARSTAIGGGVQLDEETILFKSNHNLANGQAIVYDRNGNDALSTGDYKQPNNPDTGKFLQSGSVYYAKSVNVRTIELYPTFGDYTAGINTVGFSTASNVGNQKFRVYDTKQTLKSVQVIEGGSGYTNRSVHVASAGISTIFNTINFKNHGFNDGEKVIYTGFGVGGLIPMTGIRTSTEYYQILKVDDDSFRLASAGLAGTITSNHKDNVYINLTSQGTGWQTFRYPPIEVVVDAQYSNTAAGTVGIITVTPNVRGSIIDAYVYEGGVGYGSTILNFEKTPSITVKNGKRAEFKPIVNDGRITSVDIMNRGIEYTAAPDLEVVTTGISTGVGAKLRAVVSGGEITEVIVTNEGVNYVQNETSIKVTSPGSGVLYEQKVRGLRVNNLERFGNEMLSGSDDPLQYSVVGYSTDTGREHFNDNGIDHSPIIGWAYDGNPIYGPFGYTDPADKNSGIQMLQPGYTINTSNVVDRPVGFSQGFFVDDYSYNNSGNLDENNGRYGKTPEYPNGIYAYFVGITTDLSTGKLKPKFPYFIGDTWRSDPIEDNFLIDQENFDFNNSDLLRNTFPHKTSDEYADNDFIIESNEYIDQVSVVDSVRKGAVGSFQIVESGRDYKVDDSLTFDNTGTNGGGLSASVYTITGKDIAEVSTTIERYEDVVFTRKNASEISGYISTSHNLNDGDQIVISGLTTSVVKGLTGSHVIGVATDRTTLIKGIESNTNVGFVTDIYVAGVPENISAGSSIGIGTEKLKVLNIFEDRKILRVQRGISGAYISTSTNVDLVPSYLTLPLRSDNFTSKVNDVIYFNPAESVGVGVTIGIGVTISRSIGEVTEDLSIQSQSIYLPNHPFKTNQAVTFNVPAGGAALTVTPDNSAGSNFTVPASGNSETVYIIRKSRDTIGIVTQVGLTTNTNGLMFVNSASDEFTYSLSSQYGQDWTGNNWNVNNNNQVTGRIEKINSKVSVSTAHSLLKGDIVNLSVNPNESVGIGTSTAIKLKYNLANNKLLVNPIGFGSDSVLPSGGIATSVLNLTAHDLDTGDKVFYDSSTIVSSGLNTGSYYVHKIDVDNIQLGLNYSDVTKYPPEIVSIGSTGGKNQELSLINPQISVIRNNNLVFDVSDTSLAGYELKLFYDNEFNNGFVSTGKTDTFVLAGVGTVGVTTTASVTLTYNKENPVNLFYNVEKAGYISTADTDVVDHSHINYVDSGYTGTYSVFDIHSPLGVAGLTTEFTISLSKVPESLTCLPSKTDTLKYSTRSKTAKGGVDSIQNTFGGFGYKKLPTFVSIESSEGKNAEVLPLSKDISKIDSVRILDPGFEYSSDQTLRPEAFVSPIISVINSNTITGVDVTNGGNYYTAAPNLIIINTETGVKVADGILKAELVGSSINSVEILQEPKGLTAGEQTIIAVDNNNGVAIDKVNTFTNSPGRVQCVLNTPIGGFSTALYTVGDKIFVEGIEQETGIGGTFSGDGFNSEDYKHQFFTVTAYLDTEPANVEFNLSSLTSNTGLAKTDQSGYATIINEAYYPKFTVTQTRDRFLDGEPLMFLSGGVYTNVDLSINFTETDYIKVYGLHRLKVGDTVKGARSGTIAKINTITEHAGRFNVDYALRQDQGWKDDIGKLNEDHQVLPDNDYYQNLSYTVKSPILWQDLANPVNRLLHTTGLRNFADVGISSVTKAVSIGSSTLEAIGTYFFINELRADTNNIYDQVIDVTTAGSGSKSKFLKFKSKKLTDYIECRTNRVLTMDDISAQFSSAESNLTGYVDLNIDDVFATYIIQIVNPNNNERQVTELVVLEEQDDIYTLEKANLYNSSAELGELSGNLNSQSGTSSIRFTPVDKFEGDYDLKIYKSSFNTDLAGIGTQSIGYVDVTGVSTIVGTGTSTVVISGAIDELDSYHASIELTDKTTNEKNFVELYLTHDGTNSYISEFYTDTGAYPEFSGDFIGTFTSSIASNILSLTYDNTSTNQVSLRSKVVGFGTTAAGIGTYRFAHSGQPTGTERSLYLESTYSNVSAASTIVGVSTGTVTAVKSLVRVSLGTTSALHQVLMLHDTEDTYDVTYPFVSIGTTTGIGTFGSEYDGSNLNLVFHPDASFLGGADIQVQAFSQAIYTESDIDVDAPDLTYGASTESLDLLAFNAFNGTRSSKTAFTINHGGIPIFEKVFDPSQASVLDPVTGIFSINDHFFNTGERLIYTPKSTFAGVGVSACGIGSTATNIVGGVGLGTTSICPSNVYAIRINKDKFKLASTSTYANLGIGLTFTHTGGGNSHELEMYKKNEKCLMTVDGMIQSPLAWTPVNHTLNGDISIGSTYFALSGITSLAPKDILRVDDEYMEVIRVGYGTTSSAIGSGNLNVIEVGRGYVGSSATTHSNATEVRKYSGAFNVVGSKVHFTEPPKGSTDSTQSDSYNLPPIKSDFNGRVYLRNDYSDNVVYDDTSDRFTGVGYTYTVTVGGGNTVGIETGSSILLLNGIFQKPTTSNNQGNNYSYSEQAGISSISYTGITSYNGSTIKSLDDINLNQLPRGGLIVSLGSTGGLGVAPLVGAAVTNITLSGAGAITGFTTSKYGSGYRGTVSIGVTDQAYEHKFVSAGVNSITANAGGPFTVTGATYTSSTGLLKLTIPSHGLNTSNTIGIATNSLTFTCSRDNFASNHTYPRTSDPAHNANLVIQAADTHTITVGVGSGGGAGSGAVVTGTVVDNVHKFNSGGSTLTNAITPTGGTAFTPTGTPTYTPSTGILRLTKSSHGLTAPTTDQAESGTAYNPTTGILTIKATGHGFSTGDLVNIATESLVFTCAMDGNATNHAYPRLTDPISKQWKRITKVDNDTFTMDVGKSSNTSTHTFVSSTGTAISRATSTVGIATTAFGFTCAQDGHTSVHLYPRISDPAHDEKVAVVEKTATTFKLFVGIAPSGTGGRLELTINNGGTDYVNPELIFPQPTYHNLPITGVSRVGFGATTTTGTGTLLDLGVGPSKPKSDRFADAADLIEANRAFISDVAVGRMLDHPTFAGFSVPTGNNQDCKDDIVDILKAVEWNLEYGGNHRVYDAGGLYISGGAAQHIVGEEQQTIYAFQEAAKIATQVMRNDTVEEGARYAHTFVSSGIGSVTVTSPGVGAVTPTNAVYNEETGALVLTLPAGHNATNSSTVGIVTSGLTFTCSRDDHRTEHSYPRPASVHTFVLAVSNCISGSLTPTAADYNASTGDIEFTFASAHGKSNGQTITIANNSLTFTCDIDNNATQHTYPRATDPASGQNLTISGATSTKFTVNVGKSNTGDPAHNADLSCTVSGNEVTVNVGVASEYYTSLTQSKDTTITIDSQGQCADVASAIHTLVGIVTTAVGEVTLPESRTVGIPSAFEISSFDIARSGYGFKVGDVFKPVGLVTDRHLPSITSDFELTVIKTFSDSLSSWNFGEFDFIDDIDTMQDGTRTRFPIKYNGELLSFEKNVNNADSALIDLSPLLMIFINGVLQYPGEGYEFEGGTTFTFNVPPEPGDNVSVYFYRGTTGTDSVIVSNIAETLKPGDDIQSYKNDNYPNTITQDIRTVYNLAASDEVETNLYTGRGIDETTYKPLAWIKQKTDKVLGGEHVYKSRDSIESMVYPTARIIKDLSTTDVEIFVDDAQFFNHEENVSTNVIENFGGLIVNDTSPEAAKITSTVSAGGTVQGLTIVSGGSGYVGATTSISIGAPPRIGVGIGSTATATVTITNGALSTPVTITNPGLGYTIAPQVLAYTPQSDKEDINEIRTVTGVAGTITGIGTTAGIGGANLALKFTLTNAAGLVVGYPIHVFNTNVGHGVTSVDTSDAAVVGIGTTYCDNIYYIKQVNIGAGIVTCNVHSGINTNGISTVGTGITGVGNYSWGRLFGDAGIGNIIRSSSPISIGVTGLTIDSGLSTFPTIQRRDYGLRDSGALRKNW